MFRDIIVHPGIHRPLPEAQRNRAEQNHPEGRRQRISEQRKTGDKAAEHQEPPRPDFPQNRPAEKSGNRGTCRQQSRDETRIINRLVQFKPHGIPCDPQHRIRQSEADEADVNNHQQNQGTLPRRQRRKQ